MKNFISKINNNWSYRSEFMLERADQGSSCCTWKWEDRFGDDASSFEGLCFKHWNRLPRKMVESPSLKLFKSHADVASGDKVLVVALAVLG